MDVDGRAVVVTGGGGGIGAALVEAFAHEGASVVAADIDEEAVLALAARLSGEGLVVRGLGADASVEADVRLAVDEARSQFGRLDVFCANAGILELGGVELEDSCWQRSLSVNVMSHVYAARVVLPEMLRAGEGYLVHTASAAGLLTQLGSAPYSVSKHAVVALAEWLSITYGNAGIRVSCLCPQAVRTGMTAGPDPSGGLLAATAARDGMLEPPGVASFVIDAIREERFLVLPHPEVAEYERRRAEDRERWLRGMRRLQASIDEAPGRAPT